MSAAMFSEMFKFQDHDYLLIAIRLLTAISWNILLMYVVRRICLNYKNRNCSRSTNPLEQPLLGNGNRGNNLESEQVIQSEVGSGLPDVRITVVNEKNPSKLPTGYDPNGISKMPNEKNLPDIMMPNIVNLKEIKMPTVEILTNQVIEKKHTLPAVPPV